MITLANWKDYQETIVGDLTLTVMLKNAKAKK